MCNSLAIPMPPGNAGKRGQPTLNHGMGHKHAWQETVEEENGGPGRGRTPARLARRIFPNHAMITGWLATLPRFSGTRGNCQTITRPPKRGQTPAPGSQPRDGKIPSRQGLCGSVLSVSGFRFEGSGFRSACELNLWGH